MIFLISHFLRYDSFDSECLSIVLFLTYVSVPVTNNYNVNKETQGIILNFITDCVYLVFNYFMIFCFNLYLKKASVCSMFCLIRDAILKVFTNLAQANSSIVSDSFSKQLTYCICFYTFCQMCTTNIISHGYAYLQESKSNNVNKAKRRSY